MAKTVFWLARLIGIAAILFISMFALDVFEPDKPLSETAIALFIHLIPSYVLAAALAFAWRFEFAGGILFLLIGTLPYAFLRNPAWANAILSAPFLLTGLLFLASNRLAREQLQPETPVSQEPRP